MVQRARHLGAYLQAARNSEEAAQSAQAFDSGSGAGRNRDARFSVRLRAEIYFFFFFLRFTPAIFSSTPQTAPVSCSA